MLTRRNPRRLLTDLAVLAAVLSAPGLAEPRLAAAQPPGAAQQPAAPAQLPTMPVTRLDERSQAANLDAPHRLSLAFGEPVPIRDVLLMLVQDTPFSIALDPDVKGSFIGELKEITLRQAIEAVLSPRGLAYDVQGTLIRVHPRRTETRFFDLNVLDVHRAWRRTVASPDGTSLEASGGADAYAGIENGIDALLSSSGRAFVDRKGGVAQVTDFPDRLDRVALYLEALESRASRQVRLEGRLLQVSLGDAESIDWHAVRQKLGLDGDDSAAGLSAASAAAVQEALAAQGDVRVLAAPDVTTLNNEPALLRMAGERSWLTLTVVPQISADGIVQLSIAPSLGEDTGQKHPRVTESDTVARVMDGQTAVVAGLLRDGGASRPASGFAALFGAAPKKARRTETVLLLTPRVVAPGAPWAGRGTREDR